ncbi:MAG: MFS transporter [Armatimonadetes bacterium]|nr:MFS transporter [Armatimonadota bacterium]
MTPETPEPDLTPPQRHLYAAGMFAVNSMGLVLTQWVLKFYFPNRPDAVNLVPAALASWILPIGRLSDGLVDPVVGYLSDKTRSRWGRRKPFMLLGGPLACLFFVLAWCPPAVRESTGNFWYATLMLVVFFVFFAVFTGPYLALLSEVVHDPRERVGLSGLQGIYGLVGLVAGGFVPSVTMGLGWSMRATAELVAVVSAVFCLLPLLGPRDRDDAALQGQHTPPLIKSIVMTLKSRPFQSYVGAQLFFLLGLLTIVSALPYMVETLLGQKESMAGLLTGVALVSGILFVPANLKLARARGSKFGLMFAQYWFAGVAALLCLLGPLGHRPGALVLAYGLVFVLGVAVGGLYSLPNAILADVTAHDWQQTGLDRQGMFFCVQGLLLKLAYSLAPLIVGQMLYRMPSRQGLALTLVGPVAAGICVLGSLALRSYPEEEVRAAVAARIAAREEAR